MLFADIVDFTPISAGIPPHEVVERLDAFSDFDDLAERFGLEEIKTIGNAYRVLWGRHGQHCQQDGESHGAPGKIQVTERVVAALADGYVLEPRGTVEIKGKGAMPTWFLLGRADNGPPSR